MRSTLKEINNLFELSELYGFPLFFKSKLEINIYLHDIRINYGKREDCEFTRIFNSLIDLCTPEERKNLNTTSRILEILEINKHQSEYSLQTILKAIKTKAETLVKNHGIEIKKLETTRAQKLDKKIDEFCDKFIAEKDQKLNSIVIPEEPRKQPLLDFFLYDYIGIKRKKEAVTIAAQ